MPLYEYECSSCTKKTEVRKNMSDPDPVCDCCGGGLTQILSAPQLRFTGSGFYITDYPRGGEKKGSTK